MLFLRALSPTAVVSIAIPISVIGTFIFLSLMDRSLNTVSLAGISFSIGMLVDSAIVVLENIDRHWIPCKIVELEFQLQSAKSIQDIEEKAFNAARERESFIPLISMNNLIYETFEDYLKQKE